MYVNVYNVQVSDINNHINTTSTFWAKHILPCTTDKLLFSDVSSLFQYAKKKSYIENYLLMSDFRVINIRQIIHSYLLNRPEVTGLCNLLNVWFILSLNNFCARVRISQFSYNSVHNYLFECPMYVNIRQFLCIFTHVFHSSATIRSQLFCCNVRFILTFHS